MSVLDPIRDLPMLATLPLGPAPAPARSPCRYARAR
jgi:hypothetical protein